MTFLNMRLAQLIELSDSGTWGNPADPGAGCPVVRSSDIRDNRLVLSDVAYRTIPEKHRAAKRLSDGDIVVVTSSGSPDHIGKCCLFSDPGDGRAYYFSNFTLRLRVQRDRAEPRWLFYWLTSHRGRAVLHAMNATTSGLRNLNKTLYLGQQVPFVPLAEQRRVAAMLDKADGVRRKRRESLRLLDEFLRSAFLEMFGDPVRNESEWAKVSASSAIERIDAGISVKGDERERRSCEWAVLKISAVTSGSYMPGECKVVAGPPEAPIVPRRGDLLFSRANTRELVAATCLVDREDPRVFLPDKLWRITPNRKVATPEYLRFLIGHAHFRRTLTRHATGTSGSMLNVSQEKLLRLDLPLPPMALQRRFAELVWRVFEVRARLQHAHGHDQQLLASVARRAFGTSEGAG